MKEKNFQWVRSVGTTLFGVFIGFLLANINAKRALEREMEVREESRKKEAILLLQNLKNEMQFNISAIDGVKDHFRKGIVDTIYQGRKIKHFFSSPATLTDEIWKVAVSSSLIASLQDSKSIYYFATIYRKIHLCMDRWEEIMERTLRVNLSDTLQVECYNKDVISLVEDMERAKRFCSVGIKIADITISWLKGEITQEKYDELREQIPEVTKLTTIVE